MPLFKATYDSWNEDRAPRLAAALSFYTLFSLAPLLIVAIAVAGFFYGEKAARGEFAAEIQKQVGVKLAQVVQELIKNASQPARSIKASIIGVVTLVVGAAGVFSQLQDSLNTIWGVKPPPGRGIWRQIKGRLLTFSMVVGVGLLLLASLFVSTWLAALTAFITSLHPGMGLWGPMLDFSVSAIMLTLLFALIFKLLPDTKVAWGDVWLGSAFTALVFALGKYPIGLYLGRSSVTSAYGAAGSLVVLLLWVYYCSQILLFGAEFTKAYSLRHGSRVGEGDLAAKCATPKN